MKGVCILDQCEVYFKAKIKYSPIEVVGQCRNLVLFPAFNCFRRSAHEKQALIKVTFGAHLR